VGTSGGHGTRSRGMTASPGPDCQNGDKTLSRSLRGCQGQSPDGYLCAGESRRTPATAGDPHVQRLSRRGQIKPKSQAVRMTVIAPGTSRFVPRAAGRRDATSAPNSYEVHDESVRREWKRGYRYLDTSTRLFEVANRIASFDERSNLRLPSAGGIDKERVSSCHLFHAASPRSAATLSKPTSCYSAPSQPLRPLGLTRAACVETR